MFDALVLAPCDRSAIWLGKALAVLLFLGCAEVVALLTGRRVDVAVSTADRGAVGVRAELRRRGS